MCSPTFVGTNMIFISLALPCLKRFINTSVKYVYVWHPRLWYHSQRPRPALADGAAFETVNRAACFKRFKQCFKSFCLKLFLCVSILACGCGACCKAGEEEVIVRSSRGEF